MPPSGQKRKREAGDNEESEPMQRQILPVASLPATFDGEPEDGLQYLWTVRRDARRLPNHTRVDNPYKFPSIDVEAPDANRPPPSDPKLPSEEWRQTFERRFVNFRKNMAQPTINVSLPSANSHGQKLMPEKKDRDAWWSFISGAPASVWDPPRQPKAVKKMGRYGSAGSGYGYGYGQSDYVPYEEADAVNGVSEVKKEAVQMQIGVFMDGVVTGGNVPALPSPPKPPPQQNGTQTPECDGTMSISVSDTPTWTPREPTPTLLRQIDHRTSLHLLMYFTHWLNLYLQSPTSSSAHTPLDAHARWIFALLARVDDFCVGDEVSGLRSLARACISFVQTERKRRASENDATRANDISDEKDENNETDKEGNATLKDGRMSEISCWMIVAAVVGVWAQRDLWMDAEEQLSRSS